MDKRHETMIDTIRLLQAELLANAMDPAHPPMLLPVTKTRGIQDIQPLKEAGVQAIGENRVQEILNKYTELSQDFAIHMIGRLQTNKIKYIMSKVCMVQSVDRWSLAQALDSHAQAAGIRMPVLIEINIGGEAQKAGISPEDAELFLLDCAKLPGLAVRGLMTVMPLVDDPESIRPLFRGMRTLFERIRSRAIAGIEMIDLSMGMSGDWRVAAQEGATIVRIGSAIFGERMA